MSDEPIFKFEGLKNLLKSKGYNIGDAKAWTPIVGQDVSIEQFKNGDIDFELAGGVTFKSADGEKHIGFLYKKKFYLNYNGKVGKPAMHLCKCSTIQSFIAKGSFQAEYRFAETRKVMVVDKSNYNKEVIVSDLKLCQNCIAMIQGKFHAVRDSADFEELVRKADEYLKQNPENNEKDLFGYVKGWDEISKAFREKRNYTCEKCGVHIENMFDQLYMHVHHKNGNKEDNRESNLQCLCIKCHSEVDEVHQKNFSSKAKRVIIDDFIKKYKNKNL